MSAAEYLQKNLAVMFTDISGFTEHSKTISRDELMDRLETHNSLLVPIIAHFKGNIIKTIGDAFLITFESPTNAVQCGLFMQHTLRKFNRDKPGNEQIHIKVAINAGEVAVTENDVFGDPVNITAKIEQATKADEIYFTEAVFLSMNKAEVPSAFVKHFRPKGEHSEEIKLYKVIQDEADHLYQRIISSTHIDAEKMKERVEELSRFAQRELEHYQETLDTLIEKQTKASRTSMIFTAIGVSVLAVIIIAGFLYMKNSSDRSGTMQAVESSVRSYLASGKPKAAHDLVESVAAKSGETSELDGLLKEIEDFETNEKIIKARALLEKGQDEQALSTISTIPSEEIDDQVLRDMVASARQNIDAKSLYGRGDCEGLKKKVSAQEGVRPDAGTMKLIARCDALKKAEVLVSGPVSAKKAKEAMVVITDAFGDRTSDRHAIYLLTKALQMELFERASAKGSDKAREDLEGYRKRFINVTDWGSIEREMELGGLWIYANDMNLRRAWGNWGNTEWSQKIKDLHLEGKSDTEFLWRVGMAMNDITGKLHYVPGTGIYEIQTAIERDPSLLKKHEEEMYKVVNDWIDARGDSALFMRSLVKDHYYDRMRQRMFQGLSAEDDDERMNSFAVIVEKGEIREIKDVRAFFLKHFGNFIENQKMLNSAHWKAIFSRSMAMDEYSEYRRRIESTLSDVKAKEGRWSVYRDAPKILSDMLSDLKEQQPAHTKAYIQ